MLKRRWEAAIWWIRSQFGVREAACSDRRKVPIFDRQLASFLTAFSSLRCLPPLVPNLSRVLLCGRNVKAGGRFTYLPFDQCAVDYAGPFVTILLLIWSLTYPQNDDHWVASSKPLRGQGWSRESGKDPRHLSRFTQKNTAKMTLDTTTIPGQHSVELHVQRETICLFS